MFDATAREKCQRLYRKYYAGRKFHDALYQELIARHVRPGHRLLDAGCGQYMKYCKHLSGTAQVVGLDLEALDTDNSRAPFGVRGDLHRLPFPANSFDIVISRSVIEHLQDPLQVFREWSRVLRPGGKIVILTPNKYDYVSVISAMLPYRVHRALVSRIFQISEGDIFPTLYRANTTGSLRKICGKTGLVATEVNLVNHYPAYLMFSPLLFRLGVAVERLTSYQFLRALRGSILAVFQKPAAAVETGVA